MPCIPKHVVTRGVPTGNPPPLSQGGRGLLFPGTGQLLRPSAWLGGLFALDWERWPAKHALERAKEVMPAESRRIAFPLWSWGVEGTSEE